MARRGSVREITGVEPGVIKFDYTDYWSAFDRGRSNQPIPGIGKARCACAVKSFQLAAAAGLQTHFLEQVSETAFHAKEFSVPGQFSLTGVTAGRFLALEWIWRTHVYGSLYERFANGHLDPLEFGFAPGAEIQEGMPLPKTKVECTTKLEGIDRPVDGQEAMRIASIDPETWNAVWSFIGKLVTSSNQHYEQVGFMCPDGKLEIGLSEDGEPVGIDVWGTPDENRIIWVGGANCSKDLIRNYLKSCGWKAELDKAKAAYPHDKNRWPPYPLLPQHLVDLVSDRYRNVARLYAD